MPKLFKVRIKAKNPRVLGKVFWDALAEAVSEYVQRVYPVIIAYIPIDKSQDPRRNKGVIARNLKLMDADLHGRRYLTFGVTGASEEAKRARLAIMSLHYGWAGPKTISGKVMTFPIKRVMKAGSLSSPPSGQAGRWIVTTKVQRTGRYRKDPWIWKIINNTLPLLEEIINRKLEDKPKKVRNRRLS